MKNPILGMLAGAVFTALVQSSWATISIAVVMATQELLSLPAGIAILFGAKIGTGITATLAAMGKPQDEKRATAVHVLFNVLGAAIWLPFITALAGFAEVLVYLQHVGRGELSDAEADEHARLVVATGDIENLGGGISRELAPLTKTLEEADITPSKETAALLERLLQTIQESAHFALRALIEGVERAARTVLASRDAILELTSELHKQQSARLAQDDPDRLLKHRVQIEMLDRLNRIYGIADHMAISVLPRSVLIGELSA